MEEIGWCLFPNIQNETDSFAVSFTSVEALELARKLRGVLNPCLGYKFKQVPEVSIDELAFDLVSIHFSQSAQRAARDHVLQADHAAEGSTEVTTNLRQEMTGGGGTQPNAKVFKRRSISS
jgi:hypothetical protein